MTPSLGKFEFHLRLLRKNASSKRVVRQKSYPEYLVECEWTSTFGNNFSIARMLMVNYKQIKYSESILFWVKKISGADQQKHSPASEQSIKSYIIIHSCPPVNPNCCKETSCCHMHRITRTLCHCIINFTIYSIFHQGQAIPRKKCFWPLNQHSSTGAELLRLAEDHTWELLILKWRIRTQYYGRNLSWL